MMHLSNDCAAILWSLKQVAVLSPVCLSAPVVPHNQGLRDCVFIWCNAQQHKPARYRDRMLATSIIKRRITHTTRWNVHVEQ
jgi:hypothetical protein